MTEAHPDNIISTLSARISYPTASILRSFLAITEVNKESCYERALKVFNHQGKIGAIIYVAEFIKKKSLAGLISGMTKPSI